MQNMMRSISSTKTAADVLAMLSASDLLPLRRRDMISAVHRICAMLDCEPARLSLDVHLLRSKLATVRPAAHGITAKTYSNVRSSFTGALVWAEVVAPLGRGAARRNSDWAPLLAGIAHNKLLANGLAAFANWCAGNGIRPAEVDDAAVLRFYDWLDGHTLHPRPKDLVRRVPNVWNESRKLVTGWPNAELARISFREVSANRRWEDLPEGFRADAEAYLELRRNPDLFDMGANHPKRPVAVLTLRQQQEHIRLAASILMREGAQTQALSSLADLITPEAFKTVLRHYHHQTNRNPSSFATALAKTLIDVARYHLKLSEREVEELKGLAAKLPAVTFDLTEKNKGLLRLLESDEVRARLLFLPDVLLKEAQCDLAGGRLSFVAAQLAVAVDILLVAPLRMQNLIDLHWTRNFKEPSGPKGPLLLHVPRGETKTGKRDLVYEIPKDVARNIRWYRREILSRIGADSRGHLFVTQKGKPKTQETLSQQITETLAERVGIHMTPHQFRHFAAMLYLEEHPESFQNVTDLLGHSWGKTTLIYAGSSTRRASRAYGSHVLEKRQALQVKRHARRRG
jgi:integrase